MLSLFIVCIPGDKKCYEDEEDILSSCKNSNRASCALNLGSTANGRERAWTIIYRTR
jgi:hypothetical protein